MGAGAGSVNLGMTGEPTRRPLRKIYEGLVARPGPLGGDPPTPLLARPALRPRFGGKGEVALPVIGLPSD